SYSTFSSPREIAIAFRLISVPRSDDATMFWTSISGFFLIGMPAASICFATISIACFTCSALRPGAHDLATPEEEGRGLWLFEAVDQAGELLGLVLRTAEGERDRLEVELLPEGGRSDHVLNLDFSHHIHLRGGRRSSRGPCRGSAGSGS